MKINDPQVVAPTLAGYRIGDVIRRENEYMWVVKLRENSFALIDVESNCSVGREDSLERLFKSYGSRYDVVINAELTVLRGRLK